MKILLYPEIHENYGTGNVYRMYYLYKFLLNFSSIDDVLFTCNKIQLAEKLILELGENIFLSKLETEERYDVILYDSIKPNEYLLKQLKSLSRKLIVLDYFNYSNNNIDIIINLFEQSNKDKSLFNGKIYEGINFFILKDEIMANKKNPKTIFKSKPDILITFGGEDPNDNTLKVLKNINLNKFRVKVIIGRLNKKNKKIIELYSKQVEIIDHTPEIGKLMSQSDIIICGGGTTLLEAIYLGNPVIAIPQNNMEEKFINYINQNVHLFKLRDLEWLINKYKDIQFRKSIYNSYSNFVDGKGKNRIKQIIFSRSF